MGTKIPSESYCDITDITQMLPTRKFDANSRPTLEQAEKHIKDVALKINSILRAAGYPTVPFTGATDILQLAEINKLGAAWRIEAAAMSGVQGENPVIKQYKDEFDADIEKLEDGGYSFAEAGSPPGLEPDGPDELDDGGDREEPIFSMAETERKTQF